MPYAIRKLPSSPFYEVYNKKTMRHYAKHSTKEKAEAQVRLLEQMEKKMAK